MSEKRFSKLSSSIDYFDVWDSVEEKGYTVDEVVDKLNEQQATIQKQNNEIKKLKSLLEFSNEQYGQKLLVELRFDNEWKADVSVIDNE